MTHNCPSGKKHAPATVPNAGSTAPARFLLSASQSSVTVPQHDALAKQHDSPGGKAFLAVYQKAPASGSKVACFPHNRHVSECQQLCAGLQTLGTEAGAQQPLGGWGVKGGKGPTRRDTREEAWGRC